MRHVLFFGAAFLVFPAAAAEPNNRGPVKLLTASWLGGPFDDEIVAAAIAPDGTIVVAGNAVDLHFAGVRPAVIGPPGRLDRDAAPPQPAAGQKKRPPPWQHPSTHGFIVRLSADGRKVLGHSRFGYGLATLRKLTADAKGNLLVLADSAPGIDLGDGRTEKGSFVAVLTPDGAGLTRFIRRAGILDFGVDGNGEIVVLTKARMTRYAADGQTEKWSVTWKAHGDNRPTALTVSPQTGIAAVTGYGMTHTGKQPYKDPYGHGFDRDGKPLWSLWNPDPRWERNSEFATAELPANGLMADTTGRAAASGADGKIYFTLFADGGNTICTRDPHDPFKPLDAAVFADVFQNGPGFGFKGAGRTSVVFRLDARTGKPEKGSWLSAWRDRAHANFLSIEAVAGDDKGRQFIVGNSAFGCPTKEPWYVCTESGYQGGGFLAVMDRGFRMVQCGYFPAADVRCVAVRGGRAVIAGSARHYEDEQAKVEARAFKPLQKQFGGGKKDGYFAVFEVRE